MKRIATILLAALLTASTVPAMAQMTKEEKDQCILAAKGCAGEVDSIQKKMKRLQAEIKKGGKVYTPDEMKNLEQKLKEVNDLLNSMLKPGK
jgi:uncharacterized protein YlxW (UPF0749 family)